MSDNIFVLLSFSGQYLFQVNLNKQKIFSPLDILFSCYLAQIRNFCFY